MKYNFIKEIQNIQQSSPWYYRFTRYWSGFDKIQKNKLQELETSFGKKGQCSVLEEMARLHTAITKSYSPFMQKLLGLEELSSTYMMLSEKAEQEQLEAVTAERQSKIAAECSQLKENSLVKIIKKSSTGILEEHLLAQKDYIKRLEKLPQPKLKADPFIPNDLKPKIIPSHLCDWHDNRGNYFSSDTIASTGKPATYANMKKEITAIDEAQKSVGKDLKNYPSATVEWQSASNKYDGLQGVKSYMKSWINQLWKTAPHIELNEKHQLMVTYPNIKKR